MIKRVTDRGTGAGSHAAPHADPHVDPHVDPDTGAAGAALVDGGTPAGPADDLDARKREIRAAMRVARRALPDRPVRSSRIDGRLSALPQVAGAGRFLVYRAVPGEVQTDGFVEWARSLGREVLEPEDEVDPSWPDVVIVPGVAYTRTGERLGQGGGWYDRYLPRCRDDAVVIGIAFECQIVDELPVGPHDVPVDCVVTEAGTWWRR